MARKEARKFDYKSIPGSTSILCPDEWQKAERSIIRLKVNARDPIVGRSDYSRIIPREFCGYWYLYKDNYQQSLGTIDFKSMEIYNDKQIWLSENVTQQMAQRVPLPEVTEPAENIEEFSELLLFGGELLSATIGGLDIPILSDLQQFALSFFENLSSDDLDYIPAPYRPDTLYVSIPTGKVSLDVEFIWYPYSPVALGAGIAEIDIEALQNIPNLPDALDPKTPLPLLDFDDLARDNGYIKEEDVGESFWKISANFSSTGSVGSFQFIVRSKRRPIVTTESVVKTTPYRRLILNAVAGCGGGATGYVTITPPRPYEVAFLYIDCGREEPEVAGIEDIVSGSLDIVWTNWVIEPC